MSTSSHKLTNVFFASHLNISLWSPPPYPRWPPSLIWAPPSAGQILVKSLPKKSLQLQYDMITWFDWTIRIFRKNFKNPSFNFLSIICQHEGAEYWYTGEVLKNSKVEKQMIMISTFGEKIEKSRKENIEKQKSFEILQNRLFSKSGNDSIMFPTFIVVVKRSLW